jgi:hypothetical protein
LYNAKFLLVPPPFLESKDLQLENIVAAKSYILSIFQLIFTLNGLFCLVARFLDSVNRMEKPLILGADVKGFQIDKKNKSGPFNILSKAKISRHTFL